MNDLEHIDKSAVLKELLGSYKSYVKTDGPNKWLVLVAYCIYLITALIVFHMFFSGFISKICLCPSIGFYVSFIAMCIVAVLYILFPLLFFRLNLKREYTSSDAIKYHYDFYHHILNAYIDSIKPRSDTNNEQWHIESIELKKKLEEILDKQKSLSDEIEKQKDCECQKNLIEKIRTIFEENCQKHNVSKSDCTLDDIIRIIEALNKGTHNTNNGGMIVNKS